ncbi:MAG TPA: alpha/beta hydrolase family protein [Anaeromyxobacteraceae bacterium]|nr:alpha/beta hydrolase family protein [Anaeromyxobacteraceae bacterium]
MRAHWLDRAFYLFLTRQPFFAEGWGDEGLLSDVSLEGARERPAAPIEIAWGPERRGWGGLVREGTFESPEPRLPAVARRARVRMLGPAAGEPGAVCLHFAASGDEGLSLRLRFAAPLLGQGIAALVLENPYYGERRPTGQPGAALRTVSDLVLMAAATVREGRSLLGWLERQGQGRLGVAGYSMGGQMAALVAATWPRPLAMAALAPSDSPASVFTEGLLRSHPRWDALRRPDGSEDRARAELRQLFLRYAVSSLEPPVEPRAAVVVANRLDGVVPPAEAERIARRWGCELRWLEGGHVSGALVEQPALRRAVADAFSRLPR